MRKLLALFTLTALLTACANSQQQEPPATRLAGGPCEGCEAVFEWGTKTLRAIDTLPGFGNGGMPVKLTGTIYQPDGKTPAPGVILYIYHTDTSGVYPTRGTETDWGRRHGYIRGWIKTGKDGRYTFYTRRPGQYPNREAPAHVHATLLEPGGNYYYLDDYYFQDDPTLPAAERERANIRGGSGHVLTLQQEGALWVGHRNIVLGRHIPGYKQ